MDDGETQAPLFKPPYVNNLVRQLLEIHFFRRIKEFRTHKDLYELLLYSQISGLYYKFRTQGDSWKNKLCLENCKQLFQPKCVHHKSFINHVYLYLIR